MEIWFFEFNIGSIFLPDIVVHAAESLGSDILPIDCDTDEEDAVSDIIYVLPGNTTQGIRVTVEPDGECLLAIHPLSSRMEIDLAFDVMRHLANGLGIEVTIDDEEADLSDEAKDDIWNACLSNMMLCFEHDDSFMVVEGVFEQYRVYGRFLRDRYPELDDRGLAAAAMEDFAMLQTACLCLERFGGASIKTQDDEDHRALVIYNRDGVGTVEDRFILQTSSGVKIATPHDFFDTCSDSDSIVRVDAVSFIMRKMPNDEWDAICIAVPGDFMNEPRTFLLRWNPAISSFRMEDYLDAIGRFKDGWQMDWSIHDWKDARKGDRFFMLREGDGVNPGIIFRGLFASDPYEDDDWRGTDTKRHYVEIECWDAKHPDEAPWITPEELDEYNPGPDWRSGHSGELLPPEQANRLEGLWHHAKTNV